MQNHYKISIVVPVYNVEKYLVRCLDSLVNQTYKNIEIICINDGSTDNSLQILEDYAQKDNRIKAFNQKNQGCSAAWNKGLDNVSGDYIMFVDSDDWIDLNCCETIINNIKKDIDILFFGNKTIFENKEMITSCEKFDKKTFEFFKDYTILLSSNKLNFRTVWGKLYKAEMLQNVRFNAELILAQDVAFVADALTKGCTIKILKEPFYKFNCCNINSITRKSYSIWLEYDLKLIDELNKIFERNNIEDEKLKLYYLDIVYGIIADRWCLYNTDKKQQYIKSTEEAYKFYEKYSIEDKKYSYGYKRIRTRHFIQKYHLTTLYFYVMSVVSFIFKKLGIWF